MRFFWPSGDTVFQDLPPEVCRPLQISNGVDLLEAPIFGISEYFDVFAAALFDRVKHLQDLLPELEDPQVELRLLRQFELLQGCTYASYSPSTHAS